MRHKFHQDTNFTNSHELIQLVGSSRIKFREDSCNSCPKFVAISVIGVYDAGAVTNG